MLDLLEPDWNLNGGATAEDLHRSVQQALVERLDEAEGAAKRTAVPTAACLATTMALVAAAHPTGRVYLGLPCALGGGFSGVRVRAGRRTPAHHRRLARSR